MSQVEPIGRKLIGRLAPSPTGAQHLGNARTFLVAWLYIRTLGGQLILRIEDLDTPRTKTWANQQAIDDLRWLGIDWDIEVPFQSTRTPKYWESLEVLKQLQRVYPCTCTRTQVEACSSAPHESYLDGVVYEGPCADRTAEDARRLDAQGQKYAWRFRFSPGLMEWTDDFLGPQRLDARRYLGDFIVARNYGPPAYQLAVTVDDHSQAVSHVLRGDDLVFSTYRQIALYNALGWSAPGWLHVPLVVGPDGKRLAKRHGDTRLSAWREQGVRAEEILGWIAQSLALTQDASPLSIRELLEVAQGTPEWWKQIPKEPWVIDSEPNSWWNKRP